MITECVYGGCDEIAVNPLRDEMKSAKQSVSALYHIID